MEDMNPSQGRKTCSVTFGFRSIAGLRATTDISSAVASAESVIVVVPLYVNENGEPDFSAIDSATEAVASSISPKPS